MNTLMIVGVVVFVCVVFFWLVIAASFFAALVFRFLPTLQTSVLGVTALDITRAIRQMPTWPVWWYKRGNQPRMPRLVLLALNSMNHTEYLYAFDPLHRLLFTPDRSVAMRLDFDDKFLIETLVRKAEEDCLSVFFMLAGGTRRQEPKLRNLGWQRPLIRLVPPRDIPQPTGAGVADRSHRPDAFLAERAVQSPNANRMSTYSTKRANSLESSIRQSHRHSAIPK